MALQSSMARDPLASYLEALFEYVSEARIAGIGTSTCGVPLQTIFIEPLLENRDPKESSAPGNRVPQSGLRILHKTPRIVILGEPGEGKTTLLRQYAAELAHDLNKLPILIELRRHRTKIASSAKLEWLRPRLPEVVSDRLERDGTWQRICARIEHGTACVLLDGFDELTADAQAQVQELISTLGSCQVALASRPQAYERQPFRGFSEYRLLQLGPEQTRSLARTICTTLAEEFAISDLSDVLAKIGETERGAGGNMARNPLFLSYMCFTGLELKKRGRLEQFPSYPAQLIGETVRAAVDWEGRRLSDEQRSRSGEGEALDQITAERVVEILAPLALKAYVSGRRVITEKQVAALPKDRRDIFNRFLLPARLVTRFGSEYGFPIETFAEYFAARGVAASDDPYRAVLDHIHDPEWERVILYAAGCLENTSASPMVRKWPQATWWLRKSIGPLLKVMAAALPKVAGEAAKQGAEAVRGPLDRWDARSRNSVEYFVTCIWRHGRQLWGLRERQAHYEKILGRDLRLALQCLASSGRRHERLGTELIAAWQQSYDMHWHYREDFIRAVFQVAAVPERLRIIRQLIHDGGNSTSAGEGLGTLAADPQLWRPLLEMTHEDGWVPFAAVDLLRGAVSEPEVYKRLIQLVCEYNLGAAEKAARALEPVAANPDIWKPLLQVINDEGPPTSYTVEALGGASFEPEVREQLLELLQSDTWPSSRNVLSAVVALEPVATFPDVKQRLLEISEPATSSNSQKESAAYLLSACAQDPEVWERLLVLACDEDDLIADYAASSLERAAHLAQVRNSLLKFASDCISRRRRSAAIALRPLLSDPEILATVLNLMEDKDENVKARAVSTLSAAVSDATVCRRFIELTSTPVEWEKLPGEISSDSSPQDICLAAIHALADVAQQERVWRYLMSLTNASNRSVAGAAVEALAGAVSQLEVRNRLLALAKESDLRSRAADALIAAAGQPEVWSRLVEVNFKSAPTQRKAAGPILIDVETYFERRAQALDKAAGDVTPKMLDELSGYAEESGKAREWLEVLVAGRDAKKAQARSDL